MTDSLPWLSIGELAARSGVATSAIRFYEKRGLISARRNSGNQRRFPRHMLRIISVIRAAQTVGLSLDEIGSMLEQLPADRAQTHEDWENISSQWRADLDGRIASLQQLRDNLDGCIGCGCLSLEKCPLFNPNDAARSLGTGPRYLMGGTAAEAIEAANED